MMPHGNPSVSGLQELHDKGVTEVLLSFSFVSATRHGF
jgi:hypothetical protein